MVKDQCPDANGVTMSDKGSGACYCEFGLTGSSGGANWQTCNLASAPAPKQELGCTFEQGDGISDREQNIGNANSPAECEQMVKDQCPDANGVTIVDAGIGACYCEFGLTGSSGGAAYKTCRLTTVEDTADAVGDPHLTTVYGKKLDLDKSDLH